MKLRSCLFQNWWSFHRLHTARAMTNLSRKSLPFSQACLSFCTPHPQQCHHSTLSSSWSPEDFLLLPHYVTPTQSLVLFPKHDDPSYVHYSEYHRTLVQVSLNFFFFEDYSNYLQTRSPMKAWVPLIYFHDAAWESFIKCKSLIVACRIKFQQTSMAYPTWPGPCQAFEILPCDCYASSPYTL